MQDNLNSSETLNQILQEKNLTISSELEKNRLNLVYIMNENKILKYGNEKEYLENNDNSVPTTLLQRMFSKHSNSSEKQILNNKLSEIEYLNFQLSQ